MKRIESRPPEGRDQVLTRFGEILQELLWLEPRALAAILVDAEGETVDYASSLPSYYTRVAAANLRVVLDDVGHAWQRIPAGETLAQIIVRAGGRTFVARPLEDGYALILVLRRRSFDVSLRAVAFSVCRLAREAGWATPPEETLPWHPVEVETARPRRSRPLQMKTAAGWERIEVLGSIVGLSREKGYRCRLHGGAELTLLREPTGVWFADLPPNGLSRHEAASASASSDRNDA